MHQPWRTFVVVINRCLSGKTTSLDKTRLSRAQILWGMYYNKNVDFVELLWEDFMFQIDNRDSKKQEKMYYPRFTKAIIQHFISKDKSISMRNKLFMHTVQDNSILGSLRFVSKTEEYQHQLPRKQGNLRNLLLILKKKTLVVVEEPAEKPAKKPAARRQPDDVQIKDTPGVSVSKKKAPAKTERSKGIELLSEAVILEEAQLKKATKEANEKQTFIKGSEYVDLNKTDDEEKYEFVHTPDDYVPTDDENTDAEEYDCINKEMYSDVNVELKDT
ncbi:hypothetical protein Tco_0937673 [Tanacetum coccineum]|uniref:Uncharacterized protein n=1 Tax=Tanacetum coccineum TaxID=301880 RepID=A0ABQ5DFV7_9ASTR